MEWAKIINITPCPEPEEGAAPLGGHKTRTDSYKGGWGGLLGGVRGGKVGMRSVFVLTRESIKEKIAVVGECLRRGMSHQYWSVWDRSLGKRRVIRKEYLGIGRVESASSS